MSSPYKKLRCAHCRKEFDVEDKEVALEHARGHAKYLIHTVFYCVNCDERLYVSEFCPKCNRNKYKNDVNRATRN